MVGYVSHVNFEKDKNWMTWLDWKKNAIKRLFRFYGLRVLPAGIFASILGILLCECGPTDQAADTIDDVTADLFVDRAQQAGIDFVHFNGMTGEYYILEVMGAGGAFFDYDNDGDMDILLLQGNLLGPDKTIEDALFPPADPLPLKDRLFRNDLQIDAQGRPILRFTDVTEESGIVSTGYGMGVATGDINNDGWVDFYISNYGSNEMFLNRGDGTFTRITESSGTSDARWSTSAAFLDFDRDGWLDLYVCNYVNFLFSNHHNCYSKSTAIEYCGPLAYDALPNRLFRNRHDGTFEDVSLSSGIAIESRSSLGVVAADLNGDDWVDMYVANDMRANELWFNQKDGSFVNEALISGSAFSGDGLAQASMGVDAGDFDGDGDDDLFMTHLRGGTNTIYVNDGQGFFEDTSSMTDLAMPSMPFTGFGTAWFDYDNDGWLDIVAANGEVRLLEELVLAKDPYPIHQINQLFHNLGDGQFEEVTTLAGEVFALSEVSRGAAFADIDNDGDVDVLITNNNGPVRLLINQVGNQRPWLGLRLLDESATRDLYGTRVVAITKTGREIWRRVRADASFCSANDPRVNIGLGYGAGPVEVQVKWPDGSVEYWPHISTTKYTDIIRGQGIMLDRKASRFGSLGD